MLKPIFATSLVALALLGCNDPGKGDPPTAVIFLTSGSLNDLDPGGQVVLQVGTPGILQPKVGWTVSATSASIVGPSDQVSVTIQMAPSVPDRVTFMVHVTVSGVDVDGLPVTRDASVTINARPGFHPATDVYDVGEDETLSVVAPGPGSNDADNDGSTLLFALTEMTTTHGVVTMTQAGAFEYKPAADFFGSDSFIYQVTDGLGRKGEAMVSISVHAAADAPVAVDHAYATPEDTQLVVVAPGLRQGATDADPGDLAKLTAALVSPPSHGTVVVDTDGRFAYTPTANFVGTDSFDYRVSDGTQDSVTKKATITVGPINDPPVVIAHAYAVTEDTQRIVAAPGVLTGATDLEGDPLTAQVVTGPLHGVLVLAADGSFTYTPAANYFGSDSFTFTASDPGGPSAQATVTLTIAAVNDAPVASADSYVTNTNQVLNGTSVLANDTDIDSLILTPTVTVLASHGTVAMNADGTFVYTPTAAYFGPDAFSYEISDGAGGTDSTTVTINVNSPPEAVADSYLVSLSSDPSPYSQNVLGNDIDLDLDGTMTAVLDGVAPPELITFQSNGQFAVDFSALSVGAVITFSYHVTDGFATSAPVTVEITVIP